MRLPGPSHTLLNVFVGMLISKAIFHSGNEFGMKKHWTRLIVDAVSGKPNMHAAEEGLPDVSTIGLKIQKN